MLNHLIGQVFFTKKIYENSAKLYAFCRVLDDIADEKTDLDSKIKKFNEIRNFLKKIMIQIIKKYIHLTKVKKLFMM